MSEVFVCKSSRLAAFLIKSNCRCFRVDLDNDNNNYLVHLFDKNEKFDVAMKVWQESYAKQLK